MQPAYPYDQYPTTSAPPQPMMQQQPRPALRRLGQVRVQDFLNSPYAPQYSSPTQSVMSGMSAMTLGSIGSNMSRLSISTQLTYTYPYHNFPRNSNENRQPLAPEAVNNQFNNIMAFLANPNYSDLIENKETRANFLNTMHFLVTGETMLPQGRSDQKAMSNLVYLGEKNVAELVRQIFIKIHKEPRDYDSQTVQQNSTWSECTYRLAKNLVLIMQNQRLFEYAVERMISNPNKPNEEWPNTIYTLALLFRESQRYAGNAVLAMRLMIFGGEKPRIRKFLRILVKNPSLTKFVVTRLVQLILPTNDDLNVNLKSLALDLIGQMIRLRIPDVPRTFSAHPNILPMMLDKCFRLQCDEALLHKMTHFLIKVSTFKSSTNPSDEATYNSINDDFMKRFIEVNGFSAITEMLSHGSPRVLIGCLSFLCQHSHKEWISQQVNLEDTVIAVLKLMCSSEPLIVQSSVWFLMNIVQRSPDLKKLVISRLGPEMVIQLLCQKYNHSTDRTVTHPKLLEIVQDINSNASILLKKLLTHDSSPDAVATASAAAKQIVDMPQSQGLFVYWFANHDRQMDRSTIDMLTVLQLIAQMLPERMREVMQWKNGGRLMAETIVCCIFLVFNYYEKYGAKDILKDVKVKCFNLVLETCKDPVTAELFSRYFGKTTAQEKDSPIQLFCAVCENEAMQRNLLLFLSELACNTSYNCLRFLPKIWARHRHFEGFMNKFAQSSDEEEVKRANYLIHLAKS